MADYKEGAISGATWTRCYQITVDNPYMQTPQVGFAEAKVALIDGQLLTLGHSSVSNAFDPAAVIDIYDPATLQKTGQTVTQAELYGLLFSAYLTAATARDAAAEQPAEPQP